MIKLLQIYNLILTRLLFPLIVTAGLLMSCTGSELPRRIFPQCSTPSAQIGTTAQLLDVNFTLESVAGTINSITWSFGDGNQTVTAQTTTRHIFVTPGTYTAIAKLTNACGDEVTVSKVVVVSNTVPPTVTTQGYSDLNGMTATLRMVIDSKGNGPLTRYGVCYSSTEGIPTLLNAVVAAMTSDPTIATPISLSVDQLTTGTVYYFRGFATNAAGTGYGSVVSFLTSSPPSVTTVGSSQIGMTTASVSFRAIDAGSPPATKYGICYSATTNTPTVNAVGNLTAELAAPTLGANSILALTNLLPNTTYSYRAFATSATGTVYSPNTLTFTTQTDLDLTTGLVASYSFESNGLDASSNGNHGTLLNGATYGPDRYGKANAALQLDGINDYFDIPDNVSLRPASITVSLWLKPSALTRTMQIYNKSNFNDGTSEQYSSLIRPPLTGSGATINVDVKQNSGCVAGKGWQTSTFTSKPDFSVWHHLVAVFDGRVGKLYFDNALLSNETLPAAVIDNCTGGSLKFGAQSKGIENYFAGFIDDIRIYNRALTEAQIKALFNQ